MKKSNGIVKTVANCSAILSFILMAVSGAFFYIKCQELGLGSTVTASWMASSLFFLFLGIPLMIIAKANLPSFKFEKTDTKQ